MFFGITEARTWAKDWPDVQWAVLHQTGEIACLWCGWHAPATAEELAECLLEPDRPHDCD